MAISNGVVKWFNSEKGYGFIVNKDGEDVFFHHTALPGKDHRRNVFEGDLVEYVEERSEDNRLRTSDVISVFRVKE